MSISCSGIEKVLSTHLISLLLVTLLRKKIPPPQMSLMFKRFNVKQTFNLCFQVLTRTFSRFPSFQKARVVRDKRSNKSKG